MVDSKGVARKEAPWPPIQRSTTPPYYYYSPLLSITVPWTPLWSDLQSPGLEKIVGEDVLHHRKVEGGRVE